MKPKYFYVFTGTATFLKVYFCKFSCFAHTQKVVAAFLQKKNCPIQLSNMTCRTLNMNIEKELLKFSPTYVHVNLWRVISF